VINDEKSDSELFNDEERYKQLIWNEKLNENIKMKEEEETLNENHENNENNENWTNENEENEKKENEKTLKKIWLEALWRDRDRLKFSF
jgi:hypothetical protein